MRVEVSILSPTVSLSDALDSAAQRGLLYCVIITSQHELHRSVTLTILHGRNPQGELPGRQRTVVILFVRLATGSCRVRVRNSLQRSCGQNLYVFILQFTNKNHSTHKSDVFCVVPAYMITCSLEILQEIALAPTQS